MEASVDILLRVLRPLRGLPLYLRKTPTPTSIALGTHYSNVAKVSSRRCTYFWRNAASIKLASKLLRASM